HGAHRRKFNRYVHSFAGLRFPFCHHLLLSYRVHPSNPCTNFSCGLRPNQRLSASISGSFSCHPCTNLSSGLRPRERASAAHCPCLNSSPVTAMAVEEPCPACAARCRDARRRRDRSALLLFLLTVLLCRGDILEV